MERGEFPLKVNIMIVEDESLYRDMLRISLAQDPEIRVAGVYADPHAALNDATSLQLDAAILDIQLASDLNGFELGLRLREAFPSLGVVLLTNHREVGFLDALRRLEMVGWSYLLKNSVTDISMLSRAVKGAVQGLVVIDPGMIESRKVRKQSRLSRLTPRQLEVLELIAQGCSNRGIAQQLGVSVKSVENNVNEIFSRLNLDKGNHQVHSRVTAVLTYLHETRLS